MLVHSSLSSSLPAGLHWQAAHHLATLAPLAWVAEGSSAPGPFDQPAAAGAVAAALAGLPWTPAGATVGESGPEADLEEARLELSGRWKMLVED